jgi:hypothetical protein
MRTVGGNRDFSDWLIRMGDRKLKKFWWSHRDTIKVCHRRFSDRFRLRKKFKDVISLSDRAILCPKNDATMEVNEEPLID